MHSDVQGTWIMGINHDFICEGSGNGMFRLIPSRNLFRLFTEQLNSRHWTFHAQRCVYLWSNVLKQIVQTKLRSRSSEMFQSSRLKLQYLISLTSNKSFRHKTKFSISFQKPSDTSEAMLQNMKWKTCLHFIILRALSWMPWKVLLQKKQH